MAVPSVASSLARVTLAVTLVMLLAVAALVGWWVVDYAISPPVPTSMPVDVQ